MIFRQRSIAFMLTLIALAASGVHAQTIELTGEGWQCWLDTQAQWAKDRLHLPGVTLADLPVNAPTGGWDALDGEQAFAVSVPNTVEAYRWGHGGSPYGVKGNYQGVSWWSRSFDIPADWQGKRILLTVGSAVLRSEVFINRKLVGYDAVGNTPFEMDITEAVKFGESNRMDIRVTDPFESEVGGNFDWQDYDAKRWGETEQKIPCSHGFGGVTGDVTLRAVPQQYVADLFVKNKPLPSATQPTDVDIQVEIENLAPQAATCTLEIRIADVPDKPIWMQTREISLAPGRQTITFSASCPDAKLWDLEEGNTYSCITTLEGPDGEDEGSTTFGFRWFGPEGIGKDAVLKLNGRRIVCRTAISWGFFPVSGTVPTHEMAYKQIQTAQELGLNMLNAHRTIVHPRLLNAADRLGLLYYCEPGGYLSRGGDDFTHALAREKLLRMVRRDRNHPSVVWTNMVNEPWFDRDNAPSDYQLESMELAHAIDPTHIITWGSGWGWGIKRGGSWMIPYNMTRFEKGYFDQHWVGTGENLPYDVYHDMLYAGPGKFPGHDVPASEIVFLGEENAVSSPPQLGKLVAYYKQRGQMGWAGHDYQKWHDGWAAWLKTNDTNGAFEDVDALCRSIGNIGYFRNAKVIETLRMYNKIDGYAINGWECEKFENYSGIVDIARNPKGNPAILAEANRPSKVVVLPRTQVTTPGQEILIDFGLINEEGFQGEGELEIVVTAHGNDTVTRKAVNVTGGDTYGQLLAEAWTFTPETPGTYEIAAALLMDKNAVTTGWAQVFIVDMPKVDWPAGGQVLDESGKVAAFLKCELGYDAKAYDPAARDVPFVIVGEAKPTGEILQDLIPRVKAGMGLVILEPQAEAWVKQLAAAKLCTFERRMGVARAYKGGNLFALKHDDLLAGLPQATGMSWQYQAVSAARYTGKKAMRYGLVMDCDEVAAGSYNQNETTLGVTLGVIRHGEGRIVVSTLRILENLDSERPPVIVPKRLLCNAVSYSVK